MPVLRGEFMSVAIVLPARLKSTRLPNKLLLSATGKTLLEHTIDRAKLAQAAYPKLFTTIRVACDDEQLIRAAQRAGVDAVMTSPDHQSGTDRIEEASRDLKEDVIVNLQSDEPEIDPEYIGKVATLLTLPEPEIFNRKPMNNAPMATLATFIYDRNNFNNPNIVKVVRNELWNRALYFSRAPIPYSREGDPLFSNDGRHVYGLHHIGIYSYRREFLAEYVKLKPTPLEKLEKLEQLRALEHDFGIRVALVPNNNPGIDTPADYEAFVTRWKSQELRAKIQEPNPGAKS